MGVYEEVMENHRRWKSGFNKPMRLGVKQKLVVITCMDSRLIPEQFLGLDIGDAEIIRNGGGRVTADVCRSLLVTQDLLHCNTILVIHHNDCGAQAVVREHDKLMSTVKRQMRQNAPLWMQFFFFTFWYLSYLLPAWLRNRLEATVTRSIPPNRQGLEATVVEDVKLLRKAPMVDPHVKLYGLTYDVNTGDLSEIYRDLGLPAKGIKKGNGKANVNDNLLQKEQ